MKKQLVLKYKGKTIVDPNEKDIQDFLYESDEEIMANIVAGKNFEIDAKETETQLIWSR